MQTHGREVGRPQHVMHHMTRPTQAETSLLRAREQQQQQTQQQQQQQQAQQATPGCAPFCAKEMSHSWAQKCKWDSGQCSSCDECDALPTQEQESDWKLTLLNNESGPLCLDGSQPGWFERRTGNSKNQGKWIVVMEGASMCHKRALCHERVSGDDEQQRSLGGSGNWETRRTAHPYEYPIVGSCEERNDINVLPMICPDEKSNPDFHDWNHAVFPYCSGDAWLGQAEEQIDPWGEVDGPDDMRPWGGLFHDDGFDGGGGDEHQKYWFQGHLILRQLIEAWSGAGANATEVIVTGSSSGGSAVHYHADYFKEALPQARVSGLAMAGWFGVLDENDAWSVVVDGKKPRKKVNGSDGWIMHTNPYVPSPVAACANDLGARMDAGSEYRLHDCYQVALMHPYSKADMFVVDSFNDPFKFVQGFVQDPQGFVQGPQGFVQDPQAGPGGWTWGESGSDFGIYQDAAAAKIKQSISSTLAAKPNDGFFVTSCFTHSLDITDMAVRTVRVNGTTVQEAFRRWYFNESGETRLIDASNDPHKEECGGARLKEGNGDQ